MTPFILKNVNMLKLLWSEFMNHLDLADSSAYQRGVNFKLSGYEKRQQVAYPLLLEIESDGRVLGDSIRRIDEQLKCYNFALYHYRARYYNRITF